jgi:hypothetical protein
MTLLGIYINDQLAYEYDRATALDDKQLEFLDKMDSDMDRGLKIHGELIADPDNRDKATFVAMNLLRALQQEDHARIKVSCAFLATRLPHAVEVHARDQDNRIAIEFVESH